MIETGCKCQVFDTEFVLAWRHNHCGALPPTGLKWFQWWSQNFCWKPLHDVIQWLHSSYGDILWRPISGPCHHLACCLHFYTYTVWWTIILSSWSIIRPNYLYWYIIEVPLNPNDCMVNCAMGPGNFDIFLKPYKKPQWLHAVSTKNIDEFMITTIYHVSQCSSNDMFHICSIFITIYHHWWNYNFTDSSFCPVKISCFPRSFWACHDRSSGGCDSCRPLSGCLTYCTSKARSPMVRLVGQVWIQGRRERFNGWYMDGNPM